MSQIAAMDAAIESIRAFNRFFTRHVGAINSRFLDTDTNLAEARLLFEIAKREPVVANILQDVLGIDRGYMSRMIARLESRGWIVRDRSDTGRRVRPIRLTDSGRTIAKDIDSRQRDAVAGTLKALNSAEQRDLVQAMTMARLLLDPSADDSFFLRPARTGEVSLIASRQSILYAESHGWGRGLETLEAETTAAFLRDYKPEREHCWVADLGGVIAGAVFLTDEGEGLARLRLLHVEAFARRRGIGDALVGECIGFARDKGYREVMLWTHSVLEPARRIYARNGFECVSTEVHDTFGEPLQGETWRIMLQ
jgi:DNA-binding MarR family transcriptional regulator/GNAT superfamily N-acetyltransferase